MAYQSRYMREKYGESDNSFKEYVSRVQQAIDKAPEAQPQWLQNKKTQTPIFSTAQNAPANLVDLIKMQYDNPPNRTGFAAGSVSGASVPTNDELIAFRTELSNSPDIAMRYRWANASDEDVAAELQRRKQAELQNQEYQRLMEENAKNMTLDDYIDPSYRLNDFDKTRAQEIIDAFYEKYPKDGKWYNGDYSPNTRKAMYNDPDMQKIVILENKLNPVASLVYGAKNALPIDPFGKTYENAVEKLYDAVGADQNAYDTLHNTMEGTRSAASNAQTQNPVAYLGGYMGTNIGLYKGGKDIMLGLPGIGKGLKAAGGAISNAASKVPAVGSTLGRVLTADRVAGFLGDSALDLALDTIPNEVVTGLEEGESAAQIAKDAAGNMAQNALFNVAGEVVPATIKGTSNLITRGQMNRIADALDDGAKLTAEQISEYNRLAAKVGEIGSEDWLNVNMAKYADEMPMKNAAQPIATGAETSVPSMADMFPLSNKTPVQSETDALVNAFYNNTLTNAQIETLKPGGKNRAAFEAATGLPLPETASKTRALLKLGAEESIDGTLKTEYNGINGGAQNGTDFGTGIGGVESGRAGSSPGSIMFTDEELAALPEMDYDAALAYRDSLLEQSAKPVAERVDGAASSVSARVQPNARAQTQNAPEIPSGMKERGFAESLRTKSDLPTEVKQEFIDNPELYKSLSNETTVARAEEIFARGETEARNAFSDMLKTADPAAVPLGKMIADDLIAKGDRAGAVNVLRDMSAALTRSGQFSQAAVIALTKADPMTALQYIQRQVDTMNAAGAKKFGRKWNDFELADAEIDAFKNIDPGDTQAVETAMENVGKRISKEYPATVYEKLLELRRIGMLLNPRTMVRNTLANAAMMPVQGASGKVSALIQDITHRINPDFTPTQALHVSKESKTLASQVADNMRSVLSGDTKYYEFQGQGAGAKGQNALNDLNQYARDKTIFKGEIKSDWLSQLVDKTAYELNKVSQKTAQQDLFSGMTSEKGILENTRQLTYGLLELGDAGFVDKFFRDRLASYIEARGIKSVNDVPPEAITTALDEAMKATFKDDNALTEMLSSIKRSTNRVGGMGNFLLTFTKTPANIAMRIADYSPAGLISAAAKHVKGQTDAAQFIDDISKGLTGTGLMVLGAQLFKAGILTGPESDDKDEAAFMRTQGFKPNAVHVGDKYYTVDWAQPAASGLMMGAAIMAELEKNPDASFADASVAAGKTALNTWIEASPVKSIEDLFSSYEGLPGGVAELVQEIPGSFIPSIVGATARTVDPVQRQTYSKGDWLGTLFGGMQAKIPGASKSLPAAYDTWGRPITRQNSTGEAAFAQFVSPGTLGNANESPIDNVILELFQDTGNNKVFPRKAGWSVTVDGESKSLTNREYSDYQREMGQMSYNIAEYLVPKFDNLTDEQKVSVLDNAYSMAKDVAENELFGADLSRTTEKRMEEASALDGTQYANWAEILFAHAIIEDVTGDKVPGTDRTISGSAKKNKIAALVDAGYSQYQAMQLYDLLNG